jgi:DNA invertase Pin-like site-specific DNA recombinase
MRERSLRCAIYTRKSSEEGLEQEFNSLHAQREACSAFVQSQKHEGWKLLPSHYDDGGYSGGTMERPALQSLLADIDLGKIDLVVVYKVDRLTRALTDFAKIVERFDAKSVSFVSVTQAFNTTTSMGRLTLNVLLSFAQFEREVTGERIRDKIAASKRKGMWMGGVVPLGYSVQDRQLVPHTLESAQVRHIFERYRQLKNVDALRRELRSDGYRTKPRLVDGKSVSAHFSNGALTRILTSPLYRGLIRHRGELHPGQHPAIVSEELWDAVKAVVETRKRINTTIPRARGRNPLLGSLTDHLKRPFYATYTKKAGRLPYRYYVTKGEGERVRLPAGELEAHVIAAIEGYLSNPQRVLDSLLSNETADISATLTALRGLANATSEDRWSLWRPFIKSVVYSETKLDIVLIATELASILNVPASEQAIRIAYPIRMHRAAHDIRLVIPTATGEPEAGQRNAALLKFIARGRKWYRQITSGEHTSFRSIGKAEGVTERYVARVIRGSLLAPDIIQRVLDGRQPVTLTVQKLKKPFPSDWVDQRKFFGI